MLLFSYDFYSVKWSLRKSLCYKDDIISFSGVLYRNFDPFEREYALGDDLLTYYFNDI